MLFWMVLAFLTFAAIAAIVLPLTVKRKEAIGHLEFDRAIYSARIEEIDRDLGLERISAYEAEMAKAEEGRKLILLSDAGGPVKPNKTGTLSRARIIAVTAMVAVPTMALAIYLGLGNPSMPDQSLASRLSVDPNSQSVDDLLARAEAHLAKNQNDAKGWSVVAPVYTRMGRYQDAALAWSNVLRLAPETPDVRAMLGESLIAASDGVVTEKASALFEQELKVNPASAQARFYLAMALGQSGKHAQAAKAWSELIAGGNEEAPWMKAARQFRSDSLRLANLPNDSVPSTLPGPTKEQIIASKDMSASDRSAMINDMVAGLSEKLKADPSDKEGWQRLIRSYIVLGQKEKALSAIDQALAVHVSDADFSKAMSEFRISIEQTSSN